MMNRPLYLIIAIFTIAFLIIYVLRGSIWVKGSTINREDNPFLFWLLVLSNAAAAVWMMNAYFYGSPILDMMFKKI